MDYERIEKTQQGNGGGFSPGKLRTMLLGVEKKRKEEEQLETTFALRSQASGIEHGDCSISENCKDVDVVSVLPECSTSAPVDSLRSEMASDHRTKDNSRIRFHEDCSLDYDSGLDVISVSSSIFEFQKAERAQHRLPLAPFSKPAPSKWDDAQKWIASPTSNRHKTGQSQVQTAQGSGSRKCHIGYGSRQPSMKVVVEVPDQRLVPFEEPDTKRIDSSQFKDSGEHKLVSWEPNTYPVPDPYGKPVLMIENSVGEPAISLSRHDSSICMHSATTFVPPPSTARSVSMRDMGTEMTPIASQEPSRNGTPVRATTPLRSPTSSPGRGAPNSSSTNPPDRYLDPNKKDLSEKEMQMKTRREIMLLGTQLGKMNIAAWASKEDEDKNASSSLKTIPSGQQQQQQPAKSVVETRAAAWEEAEKAKYLARFKREEIRIQAWENHQKAKTEAEMRKIEVEVERIRGRAHDRLMNKLAAARHKAEEKRAAAEAKRNRQAAKTEQQVDYIRRTGRVPSSFFCCSGWCN